MAVHGMNGCRGACFALSSYAGLSKCRGLNRTDILLLLLGMVGAIGAGAPSTYLMVARGWALLVCSPQGRCTIPYCLNTLVRREMLITRISPAGATVPAYSVLFGDCRSFDAAVCCLSGCSVCWVIASAQLKLLPVYRCRKRDCVVQSQ